MATRRRLDAEMVRRGLAPSRERAQRDILDGRVLVGGSVAAKPARMVDPADAIVIQGDGPRFVSRAGDKLDGALQRFGVDVSGLRVLDAGASTGGFSDCLLQRGAARIVAVDVGYGQLHERVADDPRVRVLDRTNVRHLDPELVGEPIDLVTADLSFISLRLVVDAVVSVLEPHGQVVSLVKPQFEAGRQIVAKGKGLVRDPEVWAAVLEDVTSAFEAGGATIMGVMVSPITGADGNVEFLLHAQVGRDEGSDETRGAEARRAMVDAAVAAAVATQTPRSQTSGSQSSGDESPGDRTPG